MSKVLRKNGFTFSISADRVLESVRKSLLFPFKSKREMHVAKKESPTLDKVGPKKGRAQDLS